MTCGVLFVFKYFNFFGSNVNWISNQFNLNFAVDPLALILPIGLSFHTFQSLSYVVEVYRGNQKAERHFGIYSLYVMFYPQLVAGPIERPQNLLHQFYEQHRFEYQRVADGLKLMAWGLFKKVVIADRLAVVVNTVYADPTAHTGCAADPRRGVLRGPDLLRLLGLLRHGDRRRAGHGLSSDGQLPAPVRVALDRRVLDALAHLVVELVSRLRLHPARRQPPRHRPPDLQPDGDLPAERPLARRELDVRDLGWPQWAHDRRRERDPGLPERDRPHSRARQTVTVAAPRDPGRDHVSVCSSSG